MNCGLFLKYRCGGNQSQAAPKSSMLECCKLLHFCYHTKPTITRRPAKKKKRIADGKEGEKDVRTIVKDTDIDINNDRENARKWYSRV